LKVEAVVLAPGLGLRGGGGVIAPAAQHERGPVARRRAQGDGHGLVGVEEVSARAA